jgi:tripartite ATP-independent transporter DctM subunit
VSVESHLVPTDLDPAAPHPRAQGRATRALDQTLKSVLALALLSEIGVVFFNVVGRSFFDFPLLWSDEAAKLALSTIAFLGGAFAYRRNEHAFVHTLIAVLPLQWRRVCYALTEFLVLAIAVTAGINSVPLLIARWNELTPILQIHASWYALPLIIGMVVLALTAIERLLALHRPTVQRVGGAFFAFVFLLALTRDAWRPWFAGDAALALALGLFFSTVLIGLPVGFALLLGTLGFLFASGTVPTVALAQNMVDGTGNFVLLALPFFIFAGMIMETGGISLRLVRFVHALVGHFRGGLLQVMVVSMYIVSGLSGAKTADVAAVGSVMRDMLRREGYSLEQSAAVLAASAAMGETVPPSIAMLVLASVTTLSIGALFVAGIIPAAVVAVCLMTLIHFQARRSNVKRLPRASLRQVATAGLGGILPLLMPVILFAGILLGIGTPTEVSSFAVIYGIVLAGLIYRELGAREFLRCIIDCAAISGMILFILAAASSFSWVLTVAYLPQRLVEILTGVHESQWLFMLGSILLLIVVGSILEGLPALLILAPILMPIAGQVGISPLHYGIVLLIAMGIGLFMPPIGVGFYVSCAVCETTIEKSTRAMIPFLIVLFLGLMLVALVPWFTLFLPAIFHLGG